MLTAFRESDGQLVSGQLIRKRKEDRYFCPECGEEVLHARSLSGVRIGHFRHKPGALLCSYGGEGPEHERIKAEIYLHLLEHYPTAFTTLVPEYRDLSDALRPDLFLETRKGTRVAIEVQVSAINVEEMTRRFKEYTRLGVHMLWVLPYPADRLVQEQEEWGWAHGQGHYVRAVHHQQAHMLRLSEQEVFLYWAYFKRLVYWPGAGEGERSFSVMRLDEAYSPGREMLINGEHQKYNASRNSMMKRILRLEHGIRFDAFRPTYARAFRSLMRPYPIPGRYLLMAP